MRDFVRHCTVTQRETSPPFGPVAVDWCVTVPSSAVVEELLLQLPPSGPVRSTEREQPLPSAQLPVAETLAEFPFGPVTSFERDQLALSSVCEKLLDVLPVAPRGPSVEALCEMLPSGLRVVALSCV